MKSVSRQVNQIKKKENMLAFVNITETVSGSVHLQHWLEAHQ